MTPNFALDLSEDGIVLRYRASPGSEWSPVSEVPLSCEDLSDRLQGLRQIAIDLGGEDFSTEVILPPSQLLYATLKVENDAALEVPKALEDLTPYKIDQLRYDIDGAGSEVRVVAVARETLKEAEDFVGPYGLNMVRFTARPEPQNFGRSPDLGPTRFAQERFSSGSTTATISEEILVLEGAEAETIPNAPIIENANSKSGFSTNRRYSAGDPIEDVGKTVARVQSRIAIPEPTPVKKPAAPKAIVPAMRASSVPPPPPLPSSQSGTAFAGIPKENLANPIKSVAPSPTTSSPTVIRWIIALVLFAATAFLVAYSGGWLSDFIVSREENSVSIEEALASAPPITEIAPVTPLEIDGFASETELSEEANAAILMQPPLQVEPLDADQAEAAYVTTGIWQKAPKLEIAVRPGTLDNLYVASLDPGLAFEDAPALKDYAVSVEDLPRSLLPPPPADTQFSIGPNGLVRPSINGSLNADGVAIFSGAPAVDIPRRPGGLEVEAKPVLDARLAAIRPSQRPSDLIEVRERANNGGLTGTELATIRPTIRPESAQSRADAIARALAEASTSDAEEIASEYAVVASFAPVARPRNFEQIVARAVRFTPENGNQAGAASTAAIGSTGPAVIRGSRATPSGTTRTSVARAATDNNQINLGRVALVGVFGTSSNRRALVRMPNGRFKKVAVGDRVDGGRVAAISEAALRYTKSGRTVTLKMPSS